MWWAVDGTGRRYFVAVLAASDAVDDIQMSHVRVRGHQHAAGALKGGQQGEASRPITYSDAPVWAEHRDPPGCGRSCTPPGSDRNSVPGR